MSLKIKTVQSNERNSNINLGGNLEAFLQLVPEIVWSFVFNQRNCILFHLIKLGWAVSSEGYLVGAYFLNKQK